MAKVIEPLHTDEKLVNYLGPETNRVLLIFWHGLGDLIMFLNPYDKLRELYPHIHFDLAVQKGLGFDEITPDAKFITADDMNHLADLDYDIVAKIHFPMNEGQTEHTKGEWCCIYELGIPPTNGHKGLCPGRNRLVGVHFNITCLPDAANPDKETAEQIWNEILEAGYIPIETHFEHVFHNPVNRKFDFIDCTVRRVTPRVSTLVGLIRRCTAFIGVVSGNFHTALATIPSDRIMFLQKHFKLECFTRLPVARVSILPGEYTPGDIKRWLKTLNKEE